jgi:hypothetical protein
MIEILIGKRMKFCASYFVTDKEYEKYGLTIRTVRYILLEKLATTG